MSLIFIVEIGGTGQLGGLGEIVWRMRLCPRAGFVMLLTLPLLYNALSIYGIR